MTHHIHKTVFHKAVESVGGGYAHPAVQEQVGDDVWSSEVWRVVEEPTTDRIEVAVCFAVYLHCTEEHQ